MEIIAVTNVNYAVPSDTMILKYVSNEEKALAFIKEEFARINPRSITKLLEPNSSEFKWNKRIEYHSRNGNYPCAYELRVITVE